MGRLTIAVSGSAGCVGSRLVPVLEEMGCAVVTLPGPDSVLPPDVRLDAFVNLAWRGSRGPARADYALQLEMARMSLDFYRLALSRGARRFVNPGTIGELMVEDPECGSVRSQNLVYVNAKSALRRMLRAIEDAPRCRVVWARLGNVYGPSDTGNILGWAVSKIAAGERAEFGPALQPYDFISEDDCARALALLAVAPALSRCEYYVGSGNPRPLREFLLEAGRAAGREDLVAIGARPDDGTRYRAEWFDISVLAADTGFSPRTDFREGIAALAERARRKTAGGDEA